MAPAELLHLGKSTASLEEIPEDNTRGTSDLLQTPEQADSNPLLGVQNLTVTILAVTESDQLIRSRYSHEPCRDKDKSEEVSSFARVESLKAPAPGQIRLFPEGVNKLVMTRHAVTTFPVDSPDSIWRLNRSNETNVSTAESTEFQNETVQTPRELAIRWLADATLKLARRPAQASESLKKVGSGELAPVTNHLGRISLQLDKRNKQTPLTGYEIVPKPTTVGLVSQAVWAAENLANAQRWHPSPEIAQISKIINESRVDLDTFHKFKQEVASYMLVLAWRQSLLEEQADNTARDLANL